jgi:hypothetical protein
MRNILFLAFLIYSYSIAVSEGVTLSVYFTNLVTGNAAFYVNASLVDTTLGTSTPPLYKANGVLYFSVDDSDDAHQFQVDVVDQNYVHILIHKVYAYNITRKVRYWGS